MEVRAETLNVILQQIIPLSESPVPHSDNTVASTLRTAGVPEAWRGSSGVISCVVCRH